MLNVWWPNIDIYMETGLNSDIAKGGHPFPSVQTGKTNS